MSLAFSSRDVIHAHQSRRLEVLLGESALRNSFYQTKWCHAGVDPLSIHSVADLARLPFTTKDELIADQEAVRPFGTNLAYPLSRYTRYHQTSGTKGRPLRWLDTPESWNWMLDCWRQVFTLAGVVAGDRVVFPFSFGPFLGFWTAFEAASQLGCLCLPAGGLSTGARLQLMLDQEATVVCCTPTYALHLAQAAMGQDAGWSSRSKVHTLIVAGEPGGSILATRRRIEEAWQARVIDHSGMTETGPMTAEWRDRSGGLYVLEGDYIPEVVDPTSSTPTPLGEVGELIVTNLGRLGSPLIRYRTGDLVRPVSRKDDGDLALLRLEGGILGRVDDMIPIRGTNFYPSSLEAVLRRFPEVVEYQVEVDTTSSLAELRVDVEALPSSPLQLAEQLMKAIRDELLFRAEVRIVASESLPRFEMKASRVRRK